MGVLLWLWLNLCHTANQCMLSGSRTVMVVSSLARVLFRLRIIIPLTSHCHGEQVKDRSLPKTYPVKR